MCPGCITGTVFLYSRMTYKQKTEEIYCCDECGYVPLRFYLKAVKPEHQFTKRIQSPTTLPFLEPVRYAAV